jgi:hypothetical protein
VVRDGNDATQPDAFTPLITAPCFPGYPSAHGTLSNAAREVMEQLYDNGQLSITLQGSMDVRDLHVLPRRSTFTGMGFCHNHLPSFLKRRSRAGDNVRLTARCTKK